MTHLVAFLRGINVGGRTVKKEKLQEAFASLSFHNVFTFRQSGNVIFETEASDAEYLKKRIEEKLRGVLGYDVAVFIRTISQLKNIIDQDPFRGQPTEGSSFLVTLLPNLPSKFPLQLPLIIPKSTAEVISAMGTEVFSVTHGGGEGALPNPYVESRLKVKATTRNMNVIKEIVEKFGREK
ncbi:MAG: DUF1697 domain-containing protein [Candidatus Bathyarchaeia archaeon]|jgi:uncharacterized protein (DUF1697 family)